ncbi:hypothetical protein [Pseudonocardia humida]|uniref:Dolichyl-phosphate-mannose-protein mannosyltransferase n=1 Tax=Pseudonocardia humida TaxID=2800819 RepID=A0ABT1AC93_9PSEU|nr:hypothetical protein [Pseudonocardia humida]MCO1660623.1 hypothetical protein [Pseudonocardia humida]
MPRPRPEGVPVRAAAPRWAVAGAFVATALIAVVQGVRAFRRPHLVETYQASQFWVTYEHGFVRRGLPGHVLAALVGGPPTAGQVTAAAFALMALGVAALLALVLVIARSAPRPVRPTVTALLVCSPFTFALVLQDIGRYDAVGFAAMAVAVVGALRWAPGPALLASGLALLVAAAAEEVLAAFLAPVAALAAWRLMAAAGPAARAGAAAATVLPGVVLAVWGLTANPPTAALLAMVDEANAERPDIMRSSPVNAIASLSQNLRDALDHLAEMAPHVMPLLNLVFGLCCLSAAALVWRLTGRREPRLFRSLVAWCVLAAIGLGIAGIDYRRWWALAFVTLVAAVPLLRPGPRQPVPGPPVGSARPVVVVAVLAVSVAAQVVPVGAAILLDPAAQTHIILTERP